MEEPHGIEPEMQKSCLEEAAGMAEANTSQRWLCDGCCAAN